MWGQPPRLSAERKLGFFAVRRPQNKNGAKPEGVGSGIVTCFDRAVCFESGSDDGAAV